MRSADILIQKGATLPEDIQDAIVSAELSESLQKIGKKYGLHIDILGELTDEVWLVLLGETHPDEFIAHLAKRLSLTHEKAAQIASDINQEVFLPIRESIKEVIQARIDKPATEQGRSVPTLKKDEPQLTKASILGGIENPELASFYETSRSPSPKTTAPVAPAPIIPNTKEIVVEEARTLTDTTQYTAEKEETRPVEVVNRIPINKPAPSAPQATPRRTPPKPPKPPVPLTVPAEVTPAPPMPTPTSAPKPPIKPATPPRAPGIDPYREPTT